ncbi:MAG TPA: CoA transferase [Burkholderiaceae bacterium]|nr:CoA transferase [Burkholderiaceae bacterium]
MPGPLQGLRVLDLSRVLAGPWSMQTFGDMGADIIKIERPGFGDDSRHWGPPWLADGEGKPTRESAYFLSTNRNKRSVAIDITVAEGQRLVRDLTAHCDVFIENFKRGSMARFGLDYESIRKVRPDIIYLSLTGFGQEGPFADRPGYDYLFQGLGGVMSVTGERDDLPGGGPQRVGVPLVDLFTGMYSSIAILAALNHRNNTGEGQLIDLSLFDTVLALSSGQLSNYFVSGKVPPRTGTASPNIAPYGVFPASDGDLIVASANQSQWVAFCKVLGLEWMATDPRFATNAGRIANYAEMHELCSESTRRRTRTEWEELMTEAGVPAGPINDYSQAIEHPQAKFRGSRLAIDHPLGGKAPGVASPLRFSKTPVSYRMAPPLLGQHTYEVLREQLALDEAALEKLAAAGVIADAAKASSRA